jgi:hypothetical protein
MRGVDMRVSGVFFGGKLMQNRRKSNAGRGGVLWVNVEQPIWSN